MHFLIIDDEPPARNELTRLLLEVLPDARPIEASNLSEARKALAREQIDAVFLDLGIPEECGFEFFADATVADVPIVITTAHEQHAIEAIDKGAVGYLLKPIEPEKLSRAILRLNTSSARKEPTDQLIILSDQNHYWPLRPGDIIKISADDGYSLVSTLDGRALTLSRSLKEIEKVVHGYQFIRANRGEIINLTHVKVIHRKGNGEVIADMGEAGMVTFSRRQAKAMRSGKTL